MHNTGIFIVGITEETSPPFYIVIHFVYILMDFYPTSKTCHQQIWLATNMKFAGANIYGHPNYGHPNF
jgi:hypothetical protein